MNTSTSRADVYTRVTSRIVAELENGVRPWLKPWNAEHASGRITKPLRSNGQPYKGINVLMLWGEATAKGFACPIWMTYRQAQEFGAQVRKGEHGSLVVYADRIRKTGTDDNGDEVEREIPFMKGYTVFNCEQIEGLPEHFYARPSPPLPAPVPVVPVVVQTPLQAAAVAMANALNRNGYRQVDQPIYRQFQTLAKTTADGFPGTNTMNLLRSALASMSPPLPMPNVPIYPWKAAPGYDGVNAPTPGQWYGTAPGPSPLVSPGAPPASGPPAPVQPYPGAGAWQSNAAYIARYQSALTYLSSVNPAYNTQGVDGQYGPNTAAAVKAFQADHGLTQDGEAGATTAAALDAATGASGSA